ncbi:MAG: DUF5654 family protein [Candidatus Doudnabacteria bacterium]
MNEEFKEKEKRLRKELRIQSVGYIVAALGLVAGLSWNDAIKSLIDHFFKTESSGISIKFLYAIVITVLIVLLSQFLMRLGRKDE